jgi:excisionase family DNA binding protein
MNSKLGAYAQGSEKREVSVMLTVDEASRTLRVSRWTLYRLMRERQIGSVKIGRKRLIPHAAVERFAASLLGAEGYTDLM